MAAKIRFTSASIVGVVLAKVGHPQRDEPLELSKSVFQIADDDQEALSTLLLKPFRSLAPQRFTYRSEPAEMQQCAARIFEDPQNLLDAGHRIAQHLYAKSNHPNIKSGDLCIALIRDVEIQGEMKQALCLFKSESRVPFLSISQQHGDLRLEAGHGIHPDRIDKGCLILQHLEEKGYYVLTFDRSHAESRFWLRDFLGVQAIPDSQFLTTQFAGMATAAMADEKKPTASADDERPPWDEPQSARKALGYFENREHFSLQEFEETVLQSPEAKAKFAAERARLEAEHGHPLDDAFEISKKDVNKAKRKVPSLMKLDTGVDIRLKPEVVNNPDGVLEHGFDPGRGMKFVKIFYRENLTQ